MSDDALPQPDSPDIPPGPPGPAFALPPAFGNAPFTPPFPSPYTPWPQGYDPLDPRSPLPPGDYLPVRYAYPASAQTPGMAVAALVLGILSIPMCSCLVLGPLAIIFGVKARTDIDRSGGTLGGRGMATAGMWCGIGGVGILVAYVAIVAITAATRPS